MNREQTDELINSLFLVSFFQQSVDGKRRRKTHTLNSAIQATLGCLDIHTHTQSVASNKRVENLRLQGNAGSTFPYLQALPPPPPFRLSSFSLLSLSSSFVCALMYLLSTAPLPSTVSQPAYTVHILLKYKKREEGKWWLGRETTLETNSNTTKKKLMMGSL